MINPTKATTQQLQAAGFSITQLPSQAKKRQRKSVIGVKATHSRKGLRKASPAYATEAHRGTIG